jgi:Ca-activated chloride channel homolog
VRLIIAALVASLVLGCTANTPEPITLSVLASSELADLEPMLIDLRRETGVDLHMTYEGTVRASNDLATGGTGHDLAWLSSNRFLALKTPKLPLSTSIMLSPVVIGVKPDKARLLRDGGGGQPSWADIAAQAGVGELRFGFADPYVSGSGLAALIGVATAAAGTGAALRPEDVKCDKLQGFLVGKKFSAPNAAKLADEFVNLQDEVDALVTYESAVLSLNASGRIREPLEVIYPRDGIVLSDYPLMLLKPDEPGKRAAYDRVVNWLRTEPAQRAIMERTARRPVDPSLPRTDQLGKSLGPSLYFPGSQQVVDTLLTAYDRAGKGRRVVFVLDYSTSMAKLYHPSTAGTRIGALRETFATLSSVGGFDQFHLGETVTIVRFARQVLEERTVTITGQHDLDGLRDMLAADDLTDGTAIWSALDRAYRLADGGSVVLMTDGENNTGMSADDLIRAWPNRTPTYAIQFGEADRAQLDRVGELVDATTSSLLEAVKKIRGC